MPEQETNKKTRERVRKDLGQRRAERRARRRMLSAEAESQPRVGLLQRLGLTARETWWSLQERLLWPAADWARFAADTLRWPFEHAAWSVRERLIWPLQDRFAESSNGRVPRAATVSVLAVLAIGSLGTGVLVASGGDGGNSVEPPALAATIDQAEPDPEPADETTEQTDANDEPDAPSLEGPRPSFGAKTEAEKKEARAALRRLKKSEARKGSGTGQDAQKNAGTVDPETSTAETESSSQDGEDQDQANGAADDAVVDPVTGATASTVAEQRKARRKESPLSVAERFAMAFVSYEVGASGKATESVFKDTTDKDLFRSLTERPPRQPKGGKVPKARVVNVVGGPRKKDSMEVSIGLLRVDGISELRLDMTRLGRGWVVKTVRG